MDAYAEHIRQLPSRFGRICWDLVYTADVHMRSEQFERIRWKLHTHTHPEHGYTDANRWNAVLAQAIRKDAFWSREVITSATLRLAQAKSIPAALQEADKPRFPQESEAEPGTSKRAKRRKVKEPDDKSKHDGKVYTHNRKGFELCQNWNQGHCGKSNIAPCLCNLCLGPHQGSSCNKAK